MPKLTDQQKLRALMKSKTAEKSVIQRRISKVKTIPAPQISNTIAGNKRTYTTRDRTQLMEDIKKLKRGRLEQVKNVKENELIDSQNSQSNETQNIQQSNSTISKQPQMKQKTIPLTSATKNSRINPATANLPEHFFDSKELEHKIKGTPKHLEREKEMEWKKYQQELEAEAVELEEKKNKEESEEQIKRELDDAKFQIYLYQKADKLADKYEEKAKLIREIKVMEHKNTLSKVDKLMAGDFSEDESLDDNNINPSDNPKMDTSDSIHKEINSLEPLMFDNDEHTWRDRDF